jgi:hypothetical protein
MMGIIFLGIGSMDSVLRFGRVDRAVLWINFFILLDALILCVMSILPLSLLRTLVGRIVLPVAVMTAELWILPILHHSLRRLYHIGHGLTLEPIAKTIERHGIIAAGMTIFAVGLAVAAVRLLWARRELGNETSVGTP